MFIDVGQHKLNAVEFGSGETTLVTQGGWVGNWELWQEPIELMQERWRCIAFDHRGSGASDFPAEAISPTALVDDLFVVLDHFEIETCVLAGESLGALTCIQAVLREPSRFSEFIMVGGVPGSSEPAMSPLVEGSRSDYPETVRAFVEDCVPEPGCEHIKRWGRQILLRADPEAAARMFESHYEVPVMPDITQIQVPTLLIHGEKDRIVPLPMAEAVSEAIPGAELVVLPSVGHMPTLTSSHQVVEVIENWSV